jgi:hypothetical protein
MTAAVSMDVPFRKDEILRQSYGRAPWYDMDGVPVEAYVIGIAGGSASGKVRKGVPATSELGCSRSHDRL